MKGNSQQTVQYTFSGVDIFQARGPQFNCTNQVEASKTGDNDDYLSKFPESFKKIDENAKRMSKEYKNKNSSKKEDNKNLSMQASIEEFKQYNQNFHSNSQINSNQEQSFTNGFGTNKILALDCTQSLLPIPKQQSRVRQKSELSNSIASSGSLADEDGQDNNVDNSSQANPSSHFRKKINNAINKNKELKNVPQRLSTQKFTFLNQQKKKSSQNIQDKVNINTSTYDQEIHSIKKNKRRNNVVMLDKRKQIWSKNWVQIIYYIGKMRQLLNQAMLFFRPQLLTKWQLNAINDPSCDFSNIYHQHQNADYVKQYSYQKYQRFLSFRTYKKVKKFTLQNLSCFINLYQRFSFYIRKFEVELFQFLPIFNQLQKFYVFWELIIFICAVINMIYIPLQITFEFERGPFFSIYFEYVCVFVFCIDIFIRSNTQYNEIGNKIEVHKQILQNYIKKRLVIDIISIISLNRTYFKSNFCSLLFFLRIFYSTRIVDIFKEQFLLRVHISGIISLILLFSQALYFCHIFSCSFLYLGLYQKGYGEGWLVTFQLDQSSHFEQYLHSYYFSVVTMTTIGYGDYTAKTSIEYSFMIVFMIVSCGIFGYTINSIGNILYDFKLKRDQFLQQLAQINKYFRFYNTDLTLQSRARKYIEYTYSDNIQDTNISASSLDSLSPYLQLEIKHDAYKKAINKCQIITKYFSIPFIESLATKIKETILSPDQLIIEEGQTKEPHIYFVNSGMVKIFSAKNVDCPTDLKKLVNGDVFGIEEFFLEKYDVPFSVKSIGVTSLLSFTLTDFQDMLKKFPDQVEMYCYLKDSLQYNKDFSKLQLSCQSCAQYNHCVNECPYLFYGTKPQKIIRQYLNNIDKIISTFQRQTRPRFNSRFLNEEVRDRADCFFMDYQDDLSFIGYTDSEEEDDDEDDDDDDNQDDKKTLNENQQAISLQSNSQAHLQTQQQKQQSNPNLDDKKQKDDKTQKEDRPSGLPLQKTNSLTGSVKADQESFLPPLKSGAENYVYSYCNIPKSISNLPDIKESQIKITQAEIQNPKSIIAPQESNILSIPSNLNPGQVERKKQRSFTSINNISSSQGDLEQRPQQIYQNINIQSKYGNLNRQQLQQGLVNMSSRKFSQENESCNSITVVKQQSKRNIGRQISRESTTKEFEVRDRKSTKNLDQQSGAGGYSKNFNPDLDIMFKGLMPINNTQNKAPSQFDNIQQVQSVFQPQQQISIDLKDLLQLLQSYNISNQIPNSTQSKNIKDIESKKIDLDVQPSSRQRQIPEKEESRLYRMKTTKKEQEQLYDIEIDKIYNYEIYFPKYNIENVLKKLKQQEISITIKNYLFKTCKVLLPLNK
ncbi:hypothetical protein ABPG73_022074 [Tetrahymena malaccensis]